MPKSSSYLPIAFVIVGLLCSSVLNSSIAAAQQLLESRELLAEARQAKMKVNCPRHAKNLQRVTCNLQLLSQLTEGSDFKIRLSGKEYSGVVEVTKLHLSGRSIRGSLVGIPESLFTISVVDDAAAGTFHIPGQPLIRLRYGGDKGLHYVHEVALGPMDRCGGSVEIPAEERIQKEVVEAEDENNDVRSRSKSSSNGVTFDIMLVYTSLARASAGGTAAIRAECINAVEAIETTYRNSSLNISTNLVRLYEVSYNESGSYSDHLDALTDPSDGIMDSLHSERGTAGADFLGLIVADTSLGGKAWCDSDANSAMSVTRWDLAADNYVLAHEIGHNIGLAHNPEDADCTPYAIGRGHNFSVPNSTIQRHTVMAYAIGFSIRIPYYSSTGVQYEGVDTGTPSRNNQQIIFNRREACSNFRTTRMDVWVDFNIASPQHLQFGTVQFPFDTLMEGVERALPDPVSDLPVVNVLAGNTNETLTISKPMIIRACDGIVTIGN